MALNIFIYFSQFSIGYNLVGIQGSYNSYLNI